MDILKKSMAPITQKAWEEINTTSKEIFESVLTARRFVDVEGPKGIDYPAVPTGRLYIPPKQKDDEVRYGMHQIIPMIESRMSFKLSIWELDDIDRGARLPDLSALEDSARKIARFEENAIYYGLGEMQGLFNTTNQKKLSFPDDPEELLQVITEGIIRFREQAIGGPYTLVVNSENWKKLSGNVRGYPLIKQLENLLKGKILLNPNIKENFLVSERGGDFVLTLGQDLSIGYEHHYNDEVQLFFMESFAFQVIEPDAVIAIE